MVAFLGRLHVVVLHLPIGILVALALVELHAWWRKADSPTATTSLALLGSSSAVVTAAFGVFLSWNGNYEPTLLFRHKWLGIAVAIASVVTFALKAKAGSSRGYYGALAATLVLLLIGGHQGGSLTHGSEYLFAAAAARETSVDASPAALVLETHCYECHGSTQQESGLRLDERGAILAGGESGAPALVPGRAMESELVRRIALPRDDDDAMPPDGRQRLSGDEILVLIDWIHAGAPFGTAVAVEAASTESIDAIAASGIAIEPVSEDDPRLSVSLQFTADDGAALSKLAPVAAQLVWLDVNGKTLSDAEWGELARFENLERLHLERTNITDDHLALLSDLTRLEYVNVYDTGVGDEGLAHLSGLAALRDVYVWRSQITPEAVERFLEANPDVRVHGAAEEAP